MMLKWTFLQFVLMSPLISAHFGRSSLEAMSPLWNNVEPSPSLENETQIDSLKRALLEQSVDMIEILQSILVPLVGEISDQCKRDSEMFINALNNVTTLEPGNGWPYRMLDASGFIPPSGLLQGNFFWMGNFDSCLQVEAPSFKGQHCTTNVYFGPPGQGVAARTWKFPGNNPAFDVLRRTNISKDQRGMMSPLLPLFKFGRCVPDSCSVQDVAIGLTAGLNQLGETGLQVHVSSCHHKDESIPLEAGDKVMIALLSMFGALILAGTIVDIAVTQVKLKGFPHWLVQTFIGFSVISNTVKIFTTKNVKPTSMNSINGIRFLSMTWVLFSHSYSTFQGQLPVTNLLVVFDKNGPIYDSPAFEAILDGWPSVDTFFFIGALLLSFLTMKELDKQKGGNVKFWMMYYIHRYIRLTGVYAMVLAFNATLLKYFAVGPLSETVMMEHEACKEHWWTNLLYVNNLRWVYPQDSETMFRCLGQTWYLACDMFFYLISPLIIFPMWKFKSIYAALWGLVWVILGTSIPVASTWLENYPFSMSLTGSDWELYLKFFTDFYIVPWQRFQPYIMGVIGGWLMYKMRDEHRLKLNPFMVLWIWAVMGVIGALVVYGLYPAQMEQMETGVSPVGSLAARVIYQGFHRLAWSLGIGWVIIACEKGAGGPVNSILSWHLWIPLARLSYTIYLVHMSVINFFTSLPSFSVTFSHLLGVYWILAMLCFSIFVAYITVIVFEAPIVHLEKLLFVSLGVWKLPSDNKNEKKIAEVPAKPSQNGNLERRDVEENIEVDRKEDNDPKQAEEDLENKIDSRKSEEKNTIKS